MKSSRHWALRCSSSAALQLRLRGPGRLGRHDRVDQLDDGRAAALQQLVVALLDQVHARLDLLLGQVVARLAGAVDVEQRAAHPVVGHLGRALAHVRHVAVGAGDAAARVNALAPQLELGVLRLEDRRRSPRACSRRTARRRGTSSRPRTSRCRRAQALPPGERERHLGRAVVLDVALAADEGAHLVAGRVRFGSYGSARLPSRQLDRRQVRHRARRTRPAPGCR